MNICGITEQMPVRSEAHRMTWMLNDALYEAAEDIAKDDSITDKQAALRDAVNEYII